MANLNDIKSWFRTGKFPTESQFSQTWDSFWHKAEKISLSAVEGLSQILSSKADRDLVDRQVEDLRTNKENVGVARDLVNAHNVAPDAHEALFALKANDADVYHRDVLDARFSRHEEDEEMHLQEGEREAWNAHKADATLHKTSEQIRSEIVEADIPSTIARDSEVEEKLAAHNGNTLAHADIRGSIRNLETGATVAGRSEFAAKLGTAEDSYTKAQLDGKINKHIRNVAYDAVSAKFTFTFEDGTRTEIDTPLEQTVRDGRYDESTGELVLVLVSGSEIRIPAAGLVKVYAGRETPTTSTAINSVGEVRVDLKQHSIDKTHLVQPLVDELNNYATQDWVKGLGYITVGTANSSYYPNSGRGFMSIMSDGRPVLANNQGIFCKKANGTDTVETIYIDPSNVLLLGGSPSNNVPVQFYNTVSSSSGFYDTSDVRLKENIKPIELKSEEIQLYEFDKQKRHSYGVIAQEVEKLYPSTVKQNGDGYKTVNYNEILIIKCAEQDKKIRQLQCRLEAQTDSIKQLQQKLTELEIQFIRQQK